MLIPPKFTEQIWARLKTWAHAQAASQAEYSLEDCQSYLRHVCRELTGEPDALSSEAAAFYARETLAMIAKFRAAVDAEGGVA